MGTVIFYQPGPTGACLGVVVELLHHGRAPVEAHGAVDAHKGEAAGQA